MIKGEPIYRVWSVPGRYHARSVKGTGTAYLFPDHARGRSEYVIKKLGLTDDAFQEIMNARKNPTGITLPTAYD